MTDKSFTVGQRIYYVDRKGIKKYGNFLEYKIFELMTVVGALWDNQRHTGQHVGYMPIDEVFAADEEMSNPIITSVDTEDDFI